jgi:hypothetical protein
MDSDADFFVRGRSGKVCVKIRAGNSSGRCAMTMANRLSVVAAYLAFAFVGAIVLGVF